MAHITAEEYQYIKVFLMVLFLLTSLLGTVTNVTNVLIYWRMGVSDSVAVSFFYMSMIDFGVSFSALIYSIMIMLEVIEERSYIIFSIQPFSMVLFTAKLREMLYGITVLTTTFLALQRCLCVYLPFRFRTMFTMKKTIISLVILTCYLVSTFIPQFMDMRMVYTFDPLINQTRWVVTYNFDTNPIWDFNDAHHEIFLSFATQVIVMLCLVVMIRILFSASEFRQRASQGREKADPSQTSQPKTSSLAQKDLKVIRAVAVVSVVFVICNTPKIVLAIVRKAVPGFRLSRPEVFYTYRTVIAFRMEFELVNSAVNLFIYVMFNPKFRQTLMGYSELQL